MATMQKYLENSFSNQNKPQLEQGNASINIPYMVFVYREELRRLNKEAIRLSKSKLNLTQKLVSYSVDHISEYDMDELININREISFTRKLKSRLDYMKQMQKLRSIQAHLSDKC